MSIFKGANAIQPIPGMPTARRACHDLVVDADGVLRRDLVHVGTQDAATVALALRLVQIARRLPWPPFRAPGSLSLAGLTLMAVVVWLRRRAARMTDCMAWAALIRSSPTGRAAAHLGPARCVAGTAA